ncbi:MAG: UDP-3-O-(3-hydroxymyristoyl)glucosamine N-acyltransferase [Magnetococcus sp. DMHC-6]
MKLSELAHQLGLERRGEDLSIVHIAPLESAGAEDLTFVVEKKWLAKVKNAAAVLISTALYESHPEEVEKLARPFLLSRSPSVDAGRAGILLGQQEMSPSGIHPKAIIHDTAQLGEGVTVGAGAVIEAGVHIGAGSVIYAGAVIHERCWIGARCVIQSNCVIGADGFGYEQVNGRLQRIPHLGIVYIEDEVEIGANTTIDRARFGETRIGMGSKIDNLVQIGHNVEIGRQVIIVSQVGISGSCKIEDGVILAGQSGIVPHVTVGAGARIAASTGVAVDVPAGATWSGWWGHEHLKNMREINSIQKLPDFMKSVLAFMKKFDRETI